VNEFVLLFKLAHPDDIEACAGGLIASLTAQQTNVYYLITTNGDKGCSNQFCLNWTSEQIAVQRMGEAVAAAQILGVPSQNVILLDYEDGMMTSYPEVEIRSQIVGYIRSIKPSVVMTWYPYPNFLLVPSQGWADLGYHPGTDFLFFSLKAD
jgi:LmbE family N-acetylglucosaminyl deacetylase